MTSSLLEVRGLRVTLSTRDGERVLVDELDLDLHAGDCCALVGASGSGKTLTALSLLDLLAPPLRAEVDVLCFAGQRYEELSGMRAERGRGIGLVFQESSSALAPTLSVGAQLDDLIRLDHPGPANERRERAIAALERVAFPDPERRLDELPGRFSGGERQRLLLALALAREPRLLIADEPTSALDASLRREMLDLLDGLRAEGLGLIMISHDLSSVVERADSLVLLDEGRCLERRRRDEGLIGPVGSASRALLDARPKARERSSPPRSGAPLLRAMDLRVQHRVNDEERVVLQGLDLDLHVGETLGLVGESGAGKSSIAMALTLLLDERSLRGRIELDGAPIFEAGKACGDEVSLRRHVQIVFQDPVASLNARHRVEEIVGED